MRPVITSVVVTSFHRIGRRIGHRRLGMVDRRFGIGHVALGAFAALALSSVWNDAHAQAWVEDKGNLGLNLDYNLAISDKIVHDSTMATPDAGTTTQEFAISAEYIPIPHLGVTASLPLVLLKYTGDKTLYPHPGGGSYDDGATHTTLTDLRAGVRYQVLEDPVALSPHLAVSIPVADYETIGNTVAGRHLKALHIGLSAGRLFNEALYAHAMYEFSLVEKYDRTAETKRFGQNRSDAAVTVGYKLLDQKLDVHLDGSMRITHGGISFDDLMNFSPDQLLYHDAILAEDVFLAGAGVSYQITEALAANLGGRLFVTGSNTQNASVFALGLAWSPL